MPSALVVAKAINFAVQPLGNQVTQHAEHDRSGEPEKEQAIDRFEWAQELPPLRQMNVPVTQSSVVLGGTIEGLMKARCFAAVQQNGRLQGNLNQMCRRGDQRNDHHDRHAFPES
jgi:hypothetical protein